MFPSNVLLPNNKISLSFNINIVTLNSSHKGLHGSKISRVSHVRFKIYINISSHILTRKPVSVRHCKILTRKPGSVRHCKRGFTSKLHLINTQRYATRPFPIPGVAMLDGRFILATSAIYLITVVSACLLGLTRRK